MVVKTGLILLLVAGIHVTFLVVSYGQGVFVVLPYHIALFVWLCVSTAIAWAFNYTALRRARSRLWRNVAAGSTSILSLYAGVFIAFNLYGT